ncbi:uncharacterized protein LOC143249039 isoform X2 [Tachypleus tridentatus]|uniref:uncharacterized protein LOC143249039 isoform X2 n=1 Tax=Tachypleus tridentatus TaxID=6853 RepID=UPI003FD0EED1
MKLHSFKIKPSLTMKKSQEFVEESGKDILVYLTEDKSLQQHLFSTQEIRPRHLLRAKRTSTCRTDAVTCFVEPTNK